MGRWKENRNCIMKMRMNLFPLICILILISFEWKMKLQFFLILIVHYFCLIIIQATDSVFSWKEFPQLERKLFVLFIIFWTFRCTFSLFHFVFYHLSPNSLMLIGNESPFKHIWFKMKEEKIIKINVKERKR